MGVPEESVTPLLGRAFLHCNKKVAARVLLERCDSNGWLDAGFRQDLEASKKPFEDAGVEWYST